MVATSVVLGAACGSGSSGSGGSGGSPSTTATGPTTPSATSTGATAGPCTGDAQCTDDGIYCNGTPKCVEGTCVSAPIDCGAAPAGCASIACDEGASACVPQPFDVDGDGHGKIGCDGGAIPADDCDDADPDKYPGNWDGPEDDTHPDTCDDDVDQDCSGTVDDGQLQDGTTCNCTPGVSEDCGSDVGNCEFGTRTCGPDGQWGPCIGGVPPGPADTCDAGNDANCNGVANDASGGCDCINGAQEHDCGACADGDRTCAGGQWGACTGATAENVACGPCGNGNNHCGQGCTGGTPGYGDACGSCGGTINCNGQCTVDTPANYGQACGPCNNGTWGCGGSCNGGTQPGCPAGWSDIGGNTCRKTVDHYYEFSDYQYSTWGQMAGCDVGLCTEFGDSLGASVVTDVHLAYAGGGCYHNFDDAIQFQCESATITLNNAGSGTTTVHDSFYDGQGLGHWCNIYKVNNWTPIFQGSCHRIVQMHMYADIPKGCY